MNLNKVKVLFAQGDHELEKAKDALKTLNEGKVRTACRRAIGFYIDGLLELEPNDKYGSHFMAHLKGLAYDVNLSPSVRLAAMDLLEKTSAKKISGEKAIENCNIIIQYCKNKTAKYFATN